MAAGFTVHLDRIPELQQRLTEIAETQLADTDLHPTLRADYDLPLRKLPANILERIAEIEPAGQDNPEVVFVSRDLQVVSKRLVGNGQHLSLQVRDGQKRYPAIAFRKGEYFKDLPERIDLMYTLMRNEYNNTVTTQLKVIDLKPSLPKS